jgi:hypothetical protein
MEKLYLIHCGFYDPDLAGGIFESHSNHFVVASNFEEAKLKAKELESYKRYKMHIDGVLEVNTIQGHRISVERDFALHSSESEIVNHRHRDLAKGTPAIR